jgi:hypothetical protein
MSRHSSGSKNKPSKKPAEAAGKLSSLDDFLFGLIFNPEDGGNMSFRNVGLSPNYTPLQLKRL